MSDHEQDMPAVGVDLELAYLGACMTIAEAIETTALIGSQFEAPKYGALFDAMLDRHRRGLGVSQASMAEAFPDRMVDIWSATDMLSEVAAWRTHETGIRERAVRRAIRAAAVRLQDLADATGSDIDHVVTESRNAVDEATAMDERSVVSMQRDAAQVLAEHRSSVQTLPTPWPSLNDVIGGFAPGRMTVIGARPGVGKSAIASQIAYELAQHGPVVFATMEMSKGEVYSRIVSQQAGIYYGTTGLSEFLQARESEFLRTGLRDIRVMDSGTQTVQGIRAAVRAAGRERPVAGVIVDYIHLMTTPQRIDNETQRINEITRTLKQMSRDLHVPVIALSQLNRDGDRGAPTLRDLRGSGGIEQDADGVLFLYRTEDTPQHVLMMGVAKNRQGPNNQHFPLDWQPEFVRAVDPTQNRII